MPDLEAARLTDPVEHSSALLGLLVGAAAGLALGAFTVATGGLGGIVAAAVIGGAVATGAGVGEVVGSLSFVPGITSGAIASGSPDTVTNDLLAARATLDIVACGGTPPICIPGHQGKPIAQGSDSVFINDQPAARKTDKVKCSAKIEDGSHNVFIGGGTVTTMELESEVPWVYHAVIMGLGLASAVILMGPVVGLLSFAGSLAGGAGAVWVAQQMGLGEDAQKIAGLLGSFAGGMGAARGGRALLARSPRLAAAEQSFMQGALQRAPPSVRNNLASTRGATPWQNASRAVIKNGQTPGSQAALSASFQGSGNYPGVDPLANRTLNPGERIYGLVDNTGKPSGYYVRESQLQEFLANGGTRESYNQGLQIRPGNNPSTATPAKPYGYGSATNPHGYRSELRAFEAVRPTQVAQGPTVANPQYGRGGMEQVYTDAFARGDLAPSVDAAGNPISVTLPSTPGFTVPNPANVPNVSWTPFLGPQGVGSTAPLTQPGGAP